MTTTAKKNLLQKLQQARQEIKSTKLKKEGRNEYSKYDYFTPEQVESLVQKACDEVGAIVLCNLKKDEFGLFQELQFLDIDDNLKNSLTFELRTEMGEITATNASQEMGGTDTYSERYIKMKVFGIKDNNLDPDTPSVKNKKTSTKKASKSKKPESNLVLITDEQKKELNEIGDKLENVADVGMLNGWLKNENNSYDGAIIMLERYREKLKKQESK